MANYLVKEESLISIADAIREKTGETAELSFPADFIVKINDLASGSNGEGSPNNTCEITIGNSSSDTNVYYYDSTSGEIKKVVVSINATITVNMNSMLVIENSEFADGLSYVHIISGDLLLLQTMNDYIIYAKGSGNIQIMLKGDNI